LRSYHRSQGRFYAEKGEDIFVVQNREEGSTGICKESVKKGVYSAIEVTTDITGVLCTKEEWEEENSARLLISEQLDN